MRGLADCLLVLEGMETNMGADIHFFGCRVGGLMAKLGSGFYDLPKAPITPNPKPYIEHYFCYLYRSLLSTNNFRRLGFEPLSKLLVSPLINPIVVPYITPYITPFKEFRLWFI